MARKSGWKIVFLLVAALATFGPILPVYAVDCAAAMAAVVNRVFNDPEVYRQTRCARNADELVKRLVAEGVPIERINVLYLLYEGYIGRDVPIPRQGDLAPTRPRQGYLGYSWPRHVVVEVDGMILDLDYKPSPVPKQDYFKEMFRESYFHPEGNLAPHIRMRAVPAKRNREEFDRLQGDDVRVVQFLGDRNDSIPDLPVRTVEQFLQNP